MGVFNSQFIHKVVDAINVPSSPRLPAQDPSPPCQIPNTLLHPPCSSCTHASLGLCRRAERKEAQSGEGERPQARSGRHSAKKLGVEQNWSRGSRRCWVEATAAPLSKRAGGPRLRREPRGLSARPGEGILTSRCRRRPGLSPRMRSALILMS